MDAASTWRCTSLSSGVKPARFSNISRRWYKPHRCCAASRYLSGLPNHGAHDIRILGDQFSLVINPLASGIVIGNRDHIHIKPWHAAVVHW
jgi:hypothetical protein